jgi:hypothetical protein
MIANFNRRPDAVALEAGMWNVRTQRYEASRGSLVERVCRFLEQYPILHAEDEDVARGPRSIEPA